MIRFADIFLDLALRADSASQRHEDIVMSLEEAVAYHEAINGKDAPYRHPTLFLGVRVKVLDS